MPHSSSLYFYILVLWKFHNSIAEMDFFVGYDRRVDEIEFLFF